MSRKKKGRDALRSSQAHPPAGSIAPAWAERSQRRVPLSRHSPKSAKIGEAHSAPGTDLRHMRRRARNLPRGQRHKSQVLAPKQRVLQQNRRLADVADLAPGCLNWADSSHFDVRTGTAILRQKLSLGQTLETIHIRPCRGCKRVAILCLRVHRRTRVASRTVHNEWGRRSERRSPTRYCRIPPGLQELGRRTCW
jgi:hypothetical protein